MSSSVSTIISKIDVSHAELVAKISSLEAQIRALAAVKPSVSAPAPAEVKKAKRAPKNPDAPKRAPNAWILFVKRVRDLLKTNGYTEQAVGVDAPMFCSDLKKENGDLSSWSDADILARRAAWSRPEVSKQEAAGKNKPKTGSAGNSVVSAAVDDLDDDLDGGAEPAPSVSAPAKSGRKWSAEAKAKAAAKRAAKKAAESEELPASVQAAVDAVHGVSPFALHAPAPAPAPVASELAPSASDDGFKPVMLAGNQRFWVNMKTGHAYHRLADGSQGEWAGLFKRDPKPRVDSSVPDPNAAADGEEFLE